MSAGTIASRNGNATEAGYFQDVNFNGRTTATPSASSPEILQGFDDWSNIRLNQVGARRNVGGPFFDRAGRQVLGPLSISMGRWDFGRWDFASSDLGRWDFGVGDASRGAGGTTAGGTSDDGTSDDGTSGSRHLVVAMMPEGISAEATCSWATRTTLVASSTSRRR